MRRRIGVDLGGTKIEAVILEEGEGIVVRRRVPTPRGNYQAIVDAIAGLITEITAEQGTTERHTPVGVGIPGVLSPATGLVKNANTNELNGRPLDRDLRDALGRPVRLANDANCFALSEVVDGAVADAGLHPGSSTVFGIILGTGVGGGLVVRGEIVAGPDQVAGEWGHNPLPWRNDTEFPGETCWCGRRGCIEGFLSGPALERDHTRTTGDVASARDIATRAAAGDVTCQTTLARYCDRLGRALASIVNVLNPDAIVVGGGLSNLAKIYELVPRVWSRYVFSDCVSTRLLAAKHGDSSGVRGAAWLWG